MHYRPIQQTFSPIRLMVVGLVCLLTGNSFAGESSYWVFFTNKGHSSPNELRQALDDAAMSLTERAGNRRYKLNKVGVVDEADLPVNEEYVERIAELPGAKIRKVSRWLNAVSVDASADALRNIRRMPFVKELRPLARRFRDRLDLDEPLRQDELRVPVRDHDLDYGNSLRQNSFLNLPNLHDMGFRGSGVLIGICDAGFDNLDHRCFENLRVETSWDFVNDDANVADEDDHGSGRHGTRTLSILAGFDEGHLIGAAPEASIILAKTENTEWEEPVEEDAWVAAVEWMDSLGVDIITSSLGYIDWYRYEDLDGETAVTTIVANRAVEVGIVVVNAMGNTGLNHYPGEKMITPADAFDVFAIGATNRDSSLAGFSSHGPTFDGRIKPDFVTYGSSVIMASSSNDTGYAAGGGTSFSAPSIAGLCALLIEADPYLTPLSLRELLRNASHRHDDPDTLFGWGIPDGLQAYRQLSPEQIELIIPLHEGWNTVSINFRNLPARVFTEMLTPLVDADHLILAKDGHGRFYIPDVPFNNIPFWNLPEGYQLNLSDNDTLRFEGGLANYTAPMELIEGWQLIAYRPYFDLPVREAMSSLIESEALTLIKDEWGRFYFPRFDFSNMADLTPGRGYHVKLSQDAGLRYPRRRLIDEEAEVLPELAFYSSPITDQAGMSVLLLANTGIQDGDEAAFIDENGDIVGTNVFKNGACGIALWGGEESSEFPRLKVWHRSSGLEFDGTLNHVEGDESYSENGIAVFDIEPFGVEQHSLDFSVFPAPFNDRVTISFGALMENSIYEIFDLNGRSIIRGRFESGVRRASIDASAMAAGIYMLRISSKGIYSDLKIVCLK